jgi:NAD(P)-dependent dehydrogenase (short-subunit alcohol dehydrogenase family)
MGALDGVVGLVTGGASGIGLATTQRLRREGARVAVVDLQPPPAGSADLALQADVGESASWPGLVDEVRRTLGPIGVAHLNAGVGTGVSAIDELTDEAYRRAMRVNVDHVVFGMRTLVPQMAEQGGGYIVATASLAGLMPFAPDPVYTLTKHAVVGLVRSVAPQLLARGIRVAAICPGIVDTPLVGVEGAQLLRDAGFPLLSPDDIAEAVVRAVLSETTGEAWYVQPGREPAAFRFGNVPGPRTPGAEGKRPPMFAPASPG